ncbi:putative amine oxidase, FAD/NAD(P)-binding domain superfamily [Septoria linicola]|nr:putative amine oxidase, FAD/NAD(P)-binding domain superfamily [Septoria linicola]
MGYKPKGVSEIRMLNAQQAGEQVKQLETEFFTINGMSAQQLMPYPEDLFKEPAQPWKEYDGLSVEDRLAQMDIRLDDKDFLQAHLGSISSAPASAVAFTAALEIYALSGYSMASMRTASGTFKFGHGGMTNLARKILDGFSGDRIFDTKNVHFDPPLSRLRQEALAAGHLNKGAKIHDSIAETQSPWFCNTADSVTSDLLFVFSDHNGTQIVGSNGTFAIGFAFNDDKLGDRTDDAAVQRAIHSLKPHVTLRGYLSHAWETDSLAKGTWYCGSPNSNIRYHQGLQKPHGRVIMASAGWADGWRGFVDGAIEQGSQSARDVATALA